MKNHQLILFAAITCFLFFTLLDMGLPTPTGAATAEAQTLTSIIRNFLQIDYVDMPHESCVVTIRELYANVIDTPTDVVDGFYTHGPDRTASLAFTMDRVRMVGNMELIHSENIPLRGESDTLLSLDVDGVVAEPKDVRSNFFAVALYGNIVDRAFEVRRGALETPSLECSFEVQDETVDCYCETRRIYSVGRGRLPSQLTSQGLPGAVTIVERNDQRWKE